jgi:hypothetical protein
MGGIAGSSNPRLRVDALRLARNLLEHLRRNPATWSVRTCASTLWPSVDTLA